MSRIGDFSMTTKHDAIKRQAGVCAFCGVTLTTPWTNGEYKGYAHHLRPIRHGGESTVENCVYLCWGDHLLLGHGMAPFNIDPQGGGSDSWVQIEKEEFPYWKNAS